MIILGTIAPGKERNNRNSVGADVKRSRPAGRVCCHPSNEWSRPIHASLGINRGSYRPLALPAESATSPPMSRSNLTIQDLRHTRHSIPTRPHRAAALPRSRRVATDRRPCYLFGQPEKLYQGSLIMTHTDDFPRFSARSVRRGDARHRKTDGTPSRSRMQPVGLRRKPLAMPGIAGGPSPTRRAAYAISMSYS